MALHMDAAHTYGDLDEDESGDDKSEKEYNPFRFVHLDPFGCPTPYLDAALRALPHNGVLTISATDTGALYTLPDRSS